MQVRRLLSLALLSTTALAQGSIVSPLAAANTEGTGANSFPFSSTTQRRYMQIHSDLGALPLMITQLSFRLTAGTTNYTGTRTHDLELYMGHGVSALQPSYTFDNNYIGTKSLVIPRTNIVFGPQGQSVTPGPNPFTSNMDLVLPTPFLYTGANSLIWEALYYGNTSVGTSGTVDADQGVVTSGTSSITGTGCIATGRTTAMTHTFQCADVAGTLLLNGSLANGPASSLCFLGIGFTNPNLAFPGLCSNVYTDAFLTLVMGTTDTNGAFTTGTPTSSTILGPNILTGLTLTSQAFALDAGRLDPIQVCASNGRQVTVPASNTSRVDLATRLFNNAGGTTATESNFFTSTVGYSLVTRFSHL